MQRDGGNVTLSAQVMQQEGYAKLSDEQKHMA